VLPPPYWRRHIVFVLSVCPSVCLSQNLLLTSPTRRLIVDNLKLFLECFIITSIWAYCLDRRIQWFFFELWWIRESWGCEIACALISSLVTDRRELKLCGMLHCHFEVCILSGQVDPIIVLWVMEDSIRVAGVKKLVFTCR
jgi:hypothetical protein